MNKSLLLFCGVFFTLLTFNSCTLDREFTDEDLKNEYMVNWIKRYGLVDPNQDWNMAIRIVANIDIESFGQGHTVCVYNSDPSEGGLLIAKTDKSGELGIDVVEGTSRLYVRAYDESGERFISGVYAINDGKMEIAAMSRSGEYEVDENRPLSRAGETDGQYRFIIACEDLGTTGDTDFNDIVLGIYYVDGQPGLTITPLAAGGTLEAVVYYGETKCFEIHEAFGLDPLQSGNYPMTGTYNPWCGAGNVWSDNTVTDFTITKAMGNIKVKVKKNGTWDEEYRYIQAPETDEVSVPLMICVPPDWQWPTETTSISLTYPNFSDWSASATNTGWKDNFQANTYVIRNTTTGGNTQPTEEEKISTTAMDVVRNISVNSESRTYRLKVPAQILKKTPVVFALHGAGGHYNDWQIPMDPAVADAAGCIIVYPQGLERSFPLFSATATGWQADGTSEGNKDIALFKAIVDELDVTYDIDRDRIYCCGFSNGAMMTYSVANSDSEFFAACAAISGFPVNEFRHQTVNSRPMPFLHIHCTKDGTVWFSKYGTIRDAMIARNGCKPTPTQTTTVNGCTKRVYSPYSTSASSPDCSFPYIYYEYAADNSSNGHVASINDVAGEGSSSQVMWNFMSQYRLTDPYSTTLRWKMNIEDYTGGDNCISHGWSGDQWQVAYGKAKTSDNSDKHVYHAIQLKQGNYKLVFNSTGDNTKKIWVKLEKADGSITVFSKECAVGSEVVIPFNIGGTYTVDLQSDGSYRVTNGEYKLTLRKEVTTIKFTSFTIYTSGTGVSAQNCSDASFPNEPGTFEDITTTVMANRPDASGDFANITPTTENGNLVFTTNEEMRIAVKSKNINITGSDYILIKFAEPTTAGWNIAFWNNEYKNEEIPVGITEYKFYYESDMLTAKTLPQICILHLWGTSGYTIKIKGIYLHKP